jgi:glycosyltransferase involved in cell wall biosynthesis
VTAVGEHLVLVSYGFDDPGGGTRVPSTLARELVRRGYGVTVFCAGVQPLPGRGPYALREEVVDGVEVVAVHNRPSAMLDVGRPDRDLGDAVIAARFGEVLDRVRPLAVHFHNLHNLGAALVDETFARGVRALYTPHNHWLVCPTGYLFRRDLELCGGPADGGRACAPCVGSTDAAGHAHRRTELVRRFAERVDRVLAVSDAVARTLVGAGYPPELVEVVPQAMPEPEAIWSALGAARAPGRKDGPLVVGFLGSAYPHKGVHVLVEAAQHTQAEIRVEIHGDVAPAYAQHLAALDARGAVHLAGPFASADLPAILGRLDVAVVPSATWDCAPLVVAECLAGRVPVVGARMGGIPDQVRDGVDGLLHDGRDADDLARCLERLSTEPGLVERLQAGIAPPASFAAHVDALEARYRGEAPAPAAVAAPPLVRWTGAQSEASSLAIVNRTVVAGLRDLGVRVERDAPGEGLGDAPLPHPADVVVRHEWPPDFADPGASRLVLIQPWEFGSIPTAWVEPLRERVDELWVPSEHVRQMYVRDGVRPEAVQVVPNGVDLERFTPAGPKRPLPGDAAVRLLFVGGTIYRKGVDVLLDAYRAAFAGRRDVQLVVKDLGGASFYRGKTLGATLAELARRDDVPPILYLDDELADDELPALYRACDVLVHPYRGEGFAMPVLEAMACGLPVVVTGGGPTDEFCPPAAGWRIAATREPVSYERIQLETVQEPWMLEPDVDDLARLLVAAVDDAADRARRGAAARRAAEGLGWDAVCARYAARIEAVARRAPGALRPPAEPFPLPGARGLNVLATPAWRGDDDLPQLLRAYADAFGDGDDVALVLLADPVVDGDDEAIEGRVLAAAATSGVDLERVADIVILPHCGHGDDLARLHAACHAYVPLHAACAGHRRLAAAAGNPVVPPDARELRELRRGDHPARAA